MKTNDYVKYLTEQVVQYVDQPVDERRETKRAKREAKLPRKYQWFGLLPFALELSWKNRKSRKS
ncbi:YqzE family protein [Texcoconibacillus texcoconensis]|uniref:YqzE family protein n=1 Tax=Texcoconibacillus texcoconensis TaxID=1095777 RepID=A0A840QP35_9BACI|nr:YqzE family protein [Texcoconibacillus texcoconensis]MBB5173101.1 hypothetical protein [Texcoconibacillus texcoconensis]